jgi:hypothetical protein
VTSETNLIKIEMDPPKRVKFVPKILRDNEKDAKETEPIWFLIYSRTNREAISMIPTLGNRAL